MDKDHRLMEASWWGRLCKKLGLVLMGGAMLSKSLIQFSVDEQGCVPSLLFDLRPNYGGGNDENGDLLQNVPCTHCPAQCPWPCSRPTPTMSPLEIAGHSQASLGQSLLGGHCSFLLGSGAQKVLFVHSKSLLPQACVSYVIKSHWPPKLNFLGVPSPFTRSPGWEICCGR